jgi:hypothetical protein
MTDQELTPKRSLGLSGSLTKAFIGSPLTPLFLLAAFALGLVALVALPREEEPQISVPMVDIFVRDGLRPKQHQAVQAAQTIVQGHQRHRHSIQRWMTRFG